jgi:hypothetical protein
MSFPFKTPPRFPSILESMSRHFLALSALFAAISVASAQAPPAGPNTEAQRAAMKKLSFLAGKWSGPASAQLGPGKPLELIQTEDIQYRLDGLVMVVEGKGREPESGKVRFNALATISYDDAKGVYEIRAYNDGRRIDTTLETDGAGFVWGFTVGQANIRHVMRVTEKGDWSETTTVKLPNGQEYTTVRMTLQKQP